MINLNEQYDIEGTGKTKKEAILDAVGKLRDQVISCYPNQIVFHILPKDVNVKKYEEFKQSKFSKNSVKALVNIKTEIKMIEVEES